MDVGEAYKKLMERHQEAQEKLTELVALAETVVSAQHSSAGWRQTSKKNSPRPSTPLSTTTRAPARASAVPCKGKPSLSSEPGAQTPSG